MITNILIKRYLDVKKSLIAEDKIDIIILTTSLVVLIYTIVMAALSDITYDEAYTFLYHSIRNSPNFLSINLANNHPLNSFLVYISAFLFQYNEFAIRLPNIIFLLIYLISSIKISKNFPSLKILIFGLLVLYWFLIPNYFSLGRGYGISAAIVLLFLVKFVKEKQNYNRIIYNFYILLLACYAFPGLLPLIIALSVYYLFFEIKYDLLKFIKTYVFDIFFLLVNFSFILYFLFSVSASGKPLYGSNDNFFNSTFKWYLNSFSEFIPNLGNSGIIFLSSLFIAAMCVVIFFNKEKSRVSFITIVTFFLFFITSKIFDRPNITGRLLIPLYPLIILSLAEILNYTVERLRTKKAVIKKISFATFILLVFNYIVTSNFRIKNNKTAYKKEIFENLNFNTNNGFTYAIHFYKEKFLQSPPYKIIKKESSIIIDNITENLNLYYSDNKRLLFLEANNDTDIKSSFFLHITPIDTKDLPANRKQYGFDNIMLSWPKNNKKNLVKQMPKYGYRSFTIGQFDKNGRIWDKTIYKWDWLPTTKDLWSHKKNWNIPNDSLVSTFIFNLETKQQGIYILSAKIKLFEDDPSINPRITLIVNYKDGTNDIKRDFCIKKNEKFIENKIIIVTNTNKEIASISAKILAHGGCIGPAHAEIRDLKLILKTKD